MAYYTQVLQPGETVKAVGTLHWTIYVRALVALLAADVMLMLALGFGAAPLHGSMVRAAAVTFVIAVAMLLVTWLNRRTTEIVVTDRRVLYKHGIVSRHTAEMNVSMIESVDVEQDVAGRVLGYGTVLIRGSGETLEKLAHVAEPVALRSAIAAG
ncbi:MAG: PH domain-containing protein [Rhodospirillales bacterium]|nr:PH domain-containing protein [Rhodospirillales bacterium]MDE2198117.1 PH domain-containing protein [Rhodospirillales bacterium]MDE2576392.1 PH domain-containing protein [Rhodospirillales bacterium]